MKISETMARSTYAGIALAVMLVVYYLRKSRKKLKHRNTVMVVTRNNDLQDEDAKVTCQVEDGLIYLNANASFGRFEGHGGVQLHYAVTEAKDPKAVIMFFTGWSESILKYGDFFQQLSENGYTTIAVDHRSQGLSGRPLRLFREKHDHLKTHVEDFDDHLTDALQLYHEVVLPTNPGKRVILMGFSLGGLVAAHTARFIKCDGLVLLAPCLAPRTGYPAPFLRIVTASLRMIGRGENFVPGHPTGVDHRMLAPPYSRVSSSSARIRFWEKVRLEKSEVCINGMSIAHLDELLKARFSTTRTHRILPNRVLVVSADLDLFVENDAIFDFVQHLPDRISCRHVHIRGAKHEILQEREEIRSRVVEEIFAFLS